MSVSRINLFIDTHVWYAHLKVTSKVFADERDKKYFLGVVLQSKEENGFRVFAFSLLDDEAYFLLGMEEGKAGEAGQILRGLLHRYEEYRPKGRIRTVQDGEINCMPVCRAEEMLDICRYIHQRPVEKGYVKKIADYWWSSFLTYRGIYSWEFVDTRPVLWYLSDSEEKSIQIFLKLHRKADRKED